MSVLRRFALLLPSQFNDGRPVSGGLIADTLLELRQQFGAVSSETQTIQGLWQHQGELYRDQLIRVFVDVADKSENREFFVQFKEKLKSRFEQHDIWLTTYLIEVI